jgi:hypothetical protein
MGAKESKEVDELIFEEEDAFVSEEKKDEEIRKEFRKLILYAESAEVNLQRRVAERLANEALDSNRQRQIVRLGGLDLLIPLCSSEDPEVRRLSVHALANLSSDHENQPSLEERGAIDIFMDLIKDRHPQTIRQVSEAFSPFSSLLSFSELQRIGQSSLERAVQTHHRGEGCSHQLAGAHPSHLTHELQPETFSRSPPLAQGGGHSLPGEPSRG